ncbi:helix-turn-helix transcriptional regulator [Reyranella sp. CPCC 100927]|uniref:helix-turn-helix transcriptional regulator n=1 Tax=Reyranella sp. CPCC 100927 TaxID=2599616 RepID=UPI0011B3F6C5|nr:helix-turn-helix transcriptional regulator [Reyranella sp. CPCC 100927]TWT03097.1 hypothetical protein FQU96_28585 [Reyranella sp. CPCC 100927]
MVEETMLGGHATGGDRVSDGASSQRHDLLDTIGLIQDAALDPSAWVGAVERMMLLFDGIAGVLVINSADADNGRTVVQTGVDPNYQQRYFDEFARLDPVFDPRSPLMVGRPVCLSPFTPGGLFTNSTFYNEWFVPQGFHDGLGAVVYSRGTRRLWLSVARHGSGHAADQVGRFALLLPHVMRSLRVAERLDMVSNQQRALGDALAVVSHAVMLVDRRGRLVFANPAAEVLLGPDQPMSVEQGLLTARDPVTAAALEAALAAAMIDADDGQGGVRDIVVPRDRRRPLLLSVVPVGRRAADHADLDVPVAAMILVADPDVRPWARLDGFARAYGLTAAEGKILDALLDGEGVDRVAERLGIGRATVKTHLNRILAKTGTARQNELIRLVAGSLSPLRK